MKSCLLAGLLFFLPGAHAQQDGAEQAVRNMDQLDLGFQRDLRATVNEVIEQGPAAYEPAGSTPFDESRLAQSGADRPARGISSADPGAGQGLNKPKSSSVSVGEDSGITLNFQGADISALINMVSQVTGRNFIVDPRVKGKVTLVSGGSIPADDLYEIFLSVLEVHNFAAVPSGDVIKILPANLVKQRPTPTSYSGEPSESDAQITQIVTLEHAPVQELLPILRPLLPPTAHIAPHAGSNTLIITDTSSNVRRIMHLVQRMDKEQRNVDIRVIFMKYADAKKIGQIITQVGNSLRQAQGGKGRPPMQITVQVDEGLNALVLQAPEEDFPVLQALIDQLDVERPAGGDVHVVYLKYADAKDIEAVLNGLAEQKSAGAAVEGGAPLVSAAKVFIQSDETTNALIIRARQDDFDALKPVIEKLDIRRAQVFVETIIAEVAVNKESDIGVNWETNQRGSKGEQWSAKTGFSDTEGGFKIGFVNELVENIVGDVVPDLGIVLSLLRSDSDVNVISTPNLLTLDNEEAKIFVGQEVPFITGNFTTNVGTTGVISTGTGGNTGGTGGTDSNTG
ncbi:MAG: type II secretion system secretin GspD, partial [Pseudomonadota bacterium]|nr:type II secretion system secretin GspD [Pseudomonadota bacterium]